MTHAGDARARRRCLTLIIGVAAAAAGFAPTASSAASVTRALAASPAIGAAAGRPPAPRRLPGEPDLGPNVYVFSPSMPRAQIQATVDAIASQQVPNQFGTQRYALLFEPGTYCSSADPLTFQVGYYTEVAG